MKKQTLQLIVNNDVMWNAEEVKFVKVGKLSTGLRLS